jgi:hypothetical protein
VLAGKIRTPRSRHCVGLVTRPMKRMPPD